MGSGRARGDTLLVPDKGHEKGIGSRGSAHELRQLGERPPSLVCQEPRGWHAPSLTQCIYSVSPPIVWASPSPATPAARPPPVPNLPHNSIFSQRQIVQPGDAPEDLRPLTNGLLIFYHKGRGRGVQNQSHIHLHHRCRGTLFPG